MSPPSTVKIKVKVKSINRTEPASHAKLADRPSCFRLRPSALRHFYIYILKSIIGREKEKKKKKRAEIVLCYVVLFVQRGHVAEQKLRLRVAGWQCGAARFEAPSRGGGGENIYAGALVDRECYVSVRLLAVAGGRSACCLLVTVW